MDESFFSRHDIHIHVPEGSIPKDGPSAGVAMLTALASLITGRMVKKRLAMSGEITLRGEVLPVGGIKEKVIAAHRAGIRTIILPLWNQKDMDDVPDYIKNSIEFLFTDKMENLLDLALD
jgi:ATP-dependent Lon protease